jgi:cytochrome d ubiquinol oxidase subunit II
MLEFYQVFVYCVFIAALIAYAALDGFDLGVGTLHLFARNDHDRRVFLNAIGPVWDGNSVWIVIAVGVMLAAFPKFFAALFSGLYLPMMGIIFTFMFRAASLEFRSKTKSLKWRSFWDVCFFLSSLLMSVDIGMILGNLIQGLPLDKTGYIIPAERQFITLYSFVIGLFITSIFAVHGALYLLMKTEKKLQEQLERLTPYLFSIFFLFWALASAMTFRHQGQMIEPMLSRPMLWLIVLLVLAALTGVGLAFRRRRFGWAFVCSMGAIALYVILYAVGSFPNLIVSTVDPAHRTLTVYNSSSGELTLRVLTWLAAIGVPLSGFYFNFVYRTFRGKVQIDDHSY